MSLLPEGTWNSRGYIPHFDSPHLVQHITFHLGDSLPQEVLFQIKEEVELLPHALRSSSALNKKHEYIDAGYGSCLLRHPAVAQKVEETLLFFDGQRYRIFAWVIMPNHVHVLVQMRERWELNKTVASWKQFTARFMHQHKDSLGLGLPLSDASVKRSPVWQREFWDRYIRNENHFYAAVTYIHGNPVSAGLVQEAKDWPWSSAKYMEAP